MPTTATANTTKSPVIAALETSLAESYALLAQTHVAHWNVEGPAFFELHAAFQKQYEELFVAVDDIAERLRALGSLAPGGLTTLAKASSIEELPIEHLPAKDYVAHLIGAHEIVVAAFEKLRNASEEAKDLETQDVAIGRLQVHQKTLWMLRSYLKNL